MKKLLCLFALCLFAIFSGGCNQFSDEGLKSPKLDSKKAELIETIKSTTKNEFELAAPSEPENANSIYLSDIDNDGKTEAVVLMKSKITQEFMQIVYKYNEGVWNTVNIMSLQNCQAVKYLKLADINNDRKLEEIIGITNVTDSKNRLIIYSFNEKEAREVMNREFQNVAIGNAEGDNSLPSIIITEKSKIQGDYTGYLTVFKWDGTEMKKLDSIFVGEDTYHSRISVRKIRKSENAVFLDGEIGAHSGYTFVYGLKEGKLRKLVNTDKNPTFSAHPLPSEDIDGDGICEIGIEAEPPGYEDAAIAGIPYYEEWYKWDGKDGLMSVREQYFDSNSGYYFVIPAKWKGKFSIVKNENGRNNSVEFVYYDSFSPDIHRYPLITLMRADAQGWEKEKSKYHVIYTFEDNEKVLAVIDSFNSVISSNSTYSSMKLTEEDIKACIKKY